MQKSTDHTDRIRRVLQEATMPLPGDQISMILGVSAAEVCNFLKYEVNNGRLRSRRSPDSRENVEYWLISREEEPDFKWWLSITEEEILKYK